MTLVPFIQIDSCVSRVFQEVGFSSYDYDIKLKLEWLETSDHCEGVSGHGLEAQTAASTDRTAESESEAHSYSNSSITPRFTMKTRFMLKH